VLDAHGTTLRIQKVDNVEPHAYTTLGWISDDVEATVTELAGRGIHFEIYPWMEQDEHGIASFPRGSRVAWFKDPDGNLLSISGA
jgi:hypothetical protein